MCRMLIAVGNVDVNSLIDSAVLIAKDLNSRHELNRKQGQGSWKHGDGWGIAYLDAKGEWVIKKSIKAIYDDPTIDQARNIQTNLLLLHIRRKIGSETSVHNTHPFIIKDRKTKVYVFCHNGFIDEEIHYDQRFQPLGETDSEKLFYSILTDLKRSNIMKAIKKNFNRYNNLKGTNIILSTKDSTFVAMRKNKFPKYYQMCLGRTKDMIVVSSEQFDKEQPNNSPGIYWEPLNHGEIIKINHSSLKTEVHKI